MEIEPFGTLSTGPLLYLILSKDFHGNLSDAEIMRLTGLARNTYYKYKRDLREEQKEAAAIEFTQ